jgi:DCN1-like protein 1/2
LWSEFLRTKSKRPVNKDVWDQTLVFAEKVLEDGGVGFWSEDGAWPGVVDEFVESVKAERPYLDPEKKGDAMEVE